MQVTNRGKQRSNLRLNTLTTCTLIE